MAAIDVVKFEPLGQRWGWCVVDGPKLASCVLFSESGMAYAYATGYAASQVDGLRYELELVKQERDSLRLDLELERQPDPFE